MPGAGSSPNPTPSSQPAPASGPSQVKHEGRWYNPSLLAAAFCALDGHVTAYLTGLAYRLALLAAGIDVLEHHPVRAVERSGGRYTIDAGDGRTIAATRLVLAGGVWLEPMLGWLGLRVPVKCLVNQLVVSEYQKPFFPIAAVSVRFGAPCNAGGTTRSGADPSG